MPRLWRLIAMALATGPVAPVLAWGDEGHRIVALIGRSLLEPAVRTEVAAILATDKDTLTAHDIASEATWADQIREVNPGGARERTSRGHFVDIEIGSPSVDRACFNHPVLPVGMRASNGPAKDCIIDKIMQFQAELADRTTPALERLMALKFLLGLVLH
jgi:hypothetical protein